MKMQAKLSMLSASLLLLTPTAASSALIDGFEEEGFLIATASNRAGPSVHQAVDPNDVLGGDRDVFTIVHDGDGSETRLITSSEDDGVIVSANSDGSDYRVLFQYDGPGINAFNLNSNLIVDGHDAFLVSITSVSLSAPASVTISALTNAGENSEAIVRLSLPVTSPGTLVFPYASLDSIGGSANFSDVDAILVVPRLGAASSLTISEIRTSRVPEPCSLLLTMLGFSTICSFGRGVTLPLRRNALPETAPA